MSAARELGGLDLLVNNASELGGIGPLLEFDVQRFGRVFPVNAGAPIALIQLAVPLLAERRRPHREHHERRGAGAYAGWGPYGASKAALELLTRTLATELRDRGVSAVIVDPGDMRTAHAPGGVSARRHLRSSAARGDGAVLELVVRPEARGRQRRAIRGPSGGRPMAAAGVIADFELPRDLEATEPPEARGLEARRGAAARLGYRDAIRSSTRASRDLPRWLSPGDLLVVNTSGTLNAALSRDGRDGRAFEIHLSTRLPGGFWTVEVRQPGAVASRAVSSRTRGKTFRLPADGTITLLAPYPLVDPIDRSLSPVDRCACSFRAPSSRISTSMAFRFDTAT